MRRLDSIEDEMRGVVTFDLENGRYLTVPAREIAEYGTEAVFRAHGCHDAIANKERISVFRRDKKIGTVPCDFDPLTIRSNSFLYAPRGGDFRRSERGWEADKSLGPGDLEAVAGFVWHRE